jgi:CheY-like chemotaxis protein
MKPTLRILVVDEDPAVTEALELQLHAAYEVATSHDPRQVLALARVLTPDLVLCSLKMRRLPGPELAQALHEDAETRDIPLLYLVDEAGTSEAEGRPAIAKSALPHQIAARIAQLIRPH